MATIALAVLVIVGHAAELGHTLLVAHAVCEHGQLVHAHRAESPTHEQTFGAGQRRDVAVRSSDALVAEHEHCNPFALTAPAIVVARPVAPTILLDAFVLPWAVRPSQSERSESVLSFAPKNSPPRA